MIFQSAESSITYFTSFYKVRRRELRIVAIFFCADTSNTYLSTFHFVRRRQICISPPHTLCGDVKYIIHHLTLCAETSKTYFTSFHFVRTRQIRNSPSFSKCDDVKNVFHASALWKITRKTRFSSSPNRPPGTIFFVPRRHNPSHHFTREDSHLHPAYANPSAKPKPGSSSTSGGSNFFHERNGRMTPRQNDSEAHIYVTQLQGSAFYVTCYKNGTTSCRSSGKSL